MLEEIESALSLWDRARRWWSNKPSNSNPETVAERFVQLFEWHGVLRNQIPAFFGHGLTYADVVTDELLVKALDVNHIQAACDLFAVRREWLEAASDRIFDIQHSFYKYPRDFEKFLQQLLETAIDVDGSLLIADSRKLRLTEDYDALLVLYETIGYVGEQPIYRYHLCDQWVFSYWKARAYLTACVAIAWKRKVHIDGRRISPALMSSLVEGKAVPNVDHFQSRGRYPEDMALKPDVYLEGVDEGEFGQANALALWLELEAEGVMDTGLKGSFRQSFEQALDRFKSQ